MILFRASVGILTGKRHRRYYYRKTPRAPWRQRADDGLDASAADYRAEHAGRASPRDGHDRRARDTERRKKSETTQEEFGHEDQSVHARDEIRAHQTICIAFISDPRHQPGVGHVSTLHCLYSVRRGPSKLSKALNFDARGRNVLAGAHDNLPRQRLGGVLLDTDLDLRRSPKRRGRETIQPRWRTGHYAHTRGVRYTDPVRNGNMA